MEPETTRGGWTEGRGCGLIVGVIGMVGFGGCSLLYAGLLPFLHDSPSYLSSLWFMLHDWQFVAVPVGGLVLAFLSFLLVRTMIRRARTTPRE